MNVPFQKLPKVNRMLAEKLMEQESEPNKNNKKKSVEAAKLLKDDRFSAMFANPGKLLNVWQFVL